MKFATVPLGEVCAQDRASVRVGDRSELRYLGMQSIESQSGDLAKCELSKTLDAPEANSFLFTRAHVLYGKLRPYLNKVHVPAFDGKCSTELVPLRPSNELQREYLAYFLRAPSTVERISQRVAGARMPRADMSYVMSLPIPLAPGDEQRRIVDLLSRAENIVRMRREAETKAKEIIPALFQDMFGDPVRNERGWEVRRLDDVADIQGGLQVTTKRSSLPIDVPYLRVANVHRTHLDLSEIKTIRVTPPELERTRLCDGDLLVVEGHGNPAEIGRVGIWTGAIELCTHQNHLIRVRCSPVRLDPHYVWASLNSAGGRHALLRQGKTTSGLNTISVSNVKSVVLAVPQIQMQQEFAARVREIKMLQACQVHAGQRADQAFQSLLAGVFQE